MADGAGRRAAWTQRVYVPMNDDMSPARVRAEANFRKAQAKDEADKQVMAGIAAESRAVDEKTARLRALRLAREAEAAAAVVAEPKKKRATRTPR